LVARDVQVDALQRVHGLVAHAVLARDVLQLDQREAPDPAPASATFDAGAGAAAGSAFLALTTSPSCRSRSTRAGPTAMVWPTAMPCVTSWLASSDWPSSTGVFFAFPSCTTYT